MGWICRATTRSPAIATINRSTPAYNVTHPSKTKAAGLCFLARDRKMAENAQTPGGSQSVLRLRRLFPGRIESQSRAPSVLRSRRLSERLHHRSKKHRILHHCRPRRFRTRAQHRDHNLLFPVDVQVLPENSPRLERSIMHVVALRKRPPQIAVLPPNPFLSATPIAIVLRTPFPTASKSSPTNNPPGVCGSHPLAPRRQQTFLPCCSSKSFLALPPVLAHS